MRILFISTWFPFPPDNGAKLRAYYLIRALSQAHEVVLISFRPPHDNENPLMMPAFENVRVHVVKADPFQHVKKPAWVKFLSPVPVAFWPNSQMRAMIERVAESSTWDVVVTQQETVARYANHFPQTPKVMDIDTALSFQMHQRYLYATGLVARWRAWISWQKAYQWDKHTFRLYQTCVAASQAEVKYLTAMMRHSSCEIDLISNGVDCERNLPGVCEVKTDTLIYNGAITYHANYDAVQYFLAEIYPRVRQERPRVVFTITGSTKGVDRSRLQINTGVHFSGYVDDIRLAVGSSAVCVVPLREGGGTRLKILEAMALGTPVVSTSKGAEGLDVIDGEHLLIADEPQAFATAVTRLLTDEELRHKLVRNARQCVVERYDWKSIGQQFVTLVEDAVQRKQR
jgi:polysaccharide biosynthesis protein PslH